jgi:hypothetical protein
MYYQRRLGIAATSFDAFLFSSFLLQDTSRACGALKSNRQGPDHCGRKVLMLLSGGCRSADHQEMVQ